jgi:chemosensory pili system protein ChpA (sensor histidine kinase/response regulator)
MSLTSAGSGPQDPLTNDLGPLAWVLDELRKSLDGAVKAMRRFVRDAELARGSDLSELDASHLRVARQQLHQAVGALEMVGLPAPAKVLRAMEALAQRFVQRPELCSDDAAARLERASFALTEYLEGVLKGKTASAVALFPQYKAVLELADADRIHPADLWQSEWRWKDVTLPAGHAPLAYGPDVRRQMDHAVLGLVKHGETAAAQRLATISKGLAAGSQDANLRNFWTICAAYFEAASAQLTEGDVYTKRAASRILQQYAALAKGATSVSERLAQDLVFFCSRATPPEGQDCPALVAVREAYGLQATKPVDYTTEQFGRYDPALLVLARKRIASAAETWSALAGGDTNRLKVASEQFAAVAELVTKLHPESADLSRAMTLALDATVRSGTTPTASVAMEVATAVLYLEAAYEDLDPTDNPMAERAARLAQRLAHVVAGGDSEPLESWMEDLYRRVSDRQTMGSVVDELRTALSEVETSLDQFFRNPHDKAPLREVPSQLAQMRGVFSVLGLDQPAMAALRIRSSVEQFLVDDVDAQTARHGIFEKIGSSLGAMGFLIDMLSYQRALAKKLFVYDEDLGEFRPLMGREKSADMAAVEAPTEAPQMPAMEMAPPEIVTPSVVPVAGGAATASQEDDDAELVDIFLEEARSVVVNGLDAIQALRADATNLADQTTLRRAFHTLKGSSRMVGLNDFGEAAWAFEQLLNSSLAEQRPASDALLSLSQSAMHAFAHWADDIAGGDASAWQPQPFRASADALRLQGELLPLDVAHVDAVETHVPEAVETVLPLHDEPESDLGVLSADVPIEPADSSLETQIDFSSTHLVDDTSSQLPVEHNAPPVDFSATQTLELQAEKAAEPEEITLDFGDFDFGNVAPQAAVNPEPVPPAEPDIPVLTDSVQAESVVDALPVEVAPAPDQADAPTALAELPPVVDADEGIKVIGPLRLSIPLYNVYLNEADEWSRRLQTELSEWAMELPAQLPESTISLAHSLLGSSATVGFAALSELARSLEQALQHVQLHRQAQPEHAHVFNTAAEEIRRLLHQFAAGFLKEADEAVLLALEGIIDTVFPAPTIESAPVDLDEPLAESDMPEWSDSLHAQVLATEVSPSQAPVAIEPELEPEPAPEAQALAPEPAEPVVEPAPVVVAEMAPAEHIQAAAPLSLVDAQDEDIDAVDNLDPDLLAIFEEEAAELMPQLGTALRHWVARPDNLSARSEVLRLLHTLKGSARLAGAMRLGEMAHRMESAIEHLGSEGVQSIQIEPLLTRFDSLQHTFSVLGQVLEDDIASVLQDLQPEPVDDVAPLSDASAQSALPSTDGALPVEAPVALPVAPVLKAPTLKPMPATQATLLAPTTRPVANQSVRVRSQLLDRLVNQAGEVMITRSRMDARLGQLRSSLGELTGNLDRLRKQLRDVELQAESQMQSRLAQTKDTAQAFDPLEFDRFTRVQELTRMMAESVNDVATVQRNLQRSIEGTEDDLIAQGRQARELQRDLLRTRMVEFEGISDRLYGVVRQASKDAGKQVKLDILGGSIEMDRGVLERMAPAFEHMLRNAVAHGIEDAAVRTAAGKPAAGTITIHVHQESNDVSVAFSDDGAGLNLEKIRAKAHAQGLVNADGSLSDSDAANLIFTPGFSTAEQVTELAGRGIGMDVVRAEVNALGGRIETATTPQQGTTFKLVLPLTTAVTQVVILRMGEFVMGVPANLMETVLRVPVAAVQQAYEHQAFTYAGDVLPFFWAGALLQASARSHEAVGKTQPVAVFRSAGQRLALHVDEVLGNREVVVKNLGPQLSRLPGLAGMSVLASGAVVLIYNPVALATVYGEQAQALGARTVQSEVSTGAEQLPPSAAQTAATADQLPLVLVVDDSITVRRVTQRLLLREGYRVALANDGLQALEKLQEEKPAVVLSDIEMPRMDGFDLARNIRADQRWHDLPIIMITSRIAEKHREHAKELGVDHYLGKPYSEDELLRVIRSYTDTAVAA